jgi:uncharacterized protein YjbI with pentapeptide repeats
MGNEDQIRILRQGAKAWNKWREENPEHKDLRKANLSGANLRGADLSWKDLHEANLSGADLSGADLSEANLSGANLSRANLLGAILSGADLSGANLLGAILSGADLSGKDLSGANLRGAILSGADLSRANLCGTDLSGADLSRANLNEADLSGADLSEAVLIETNLEGATLTGCKIYGISAWDLKLEGARQNDMVITPSGQPIITVDNLEVAQFIYLLINNKKIRHVIDTITSKVVLILGRFTEDRKPVLDAIRDELRRRDYLPVLFDFERPANRDIAETVSTLAHMARFIIADITDAKSIPAELQRIVPELPSVPVQPVLTSDYEYALFEGLKRYPWVLPTYQYENQEALLASIAENVIKPAEDKANELKRGLEKIRCDS